MNRGKMPSQPSSRPEVTEMRHPVLEVIHAHRSIRRYRPDPVPWEMVETIVAAAQRSSTSSNLQTWSVVAVTDSEKRARLAALCGNQDHIRQAPVFLAWCADRYRLDLVCRMRGLEQNTDYVEDFLVAAVDAAIAMQTAAIAAEALGLGMCFIGGIRNHPEAVIELLGLPPRVFPISGMTLGWPDENPEPRPRLPLEAVLHRETYHRNQEPYLLAYDRQTRERGMYRRRTGEVLGWLDVAARKAARTSRDVLRAVLERQGFSLR